MACIIMVKIFNPFQGYINYVLLLSDFKICAYSVFIDVAYEDHVLDPICGLESCNESETDIIKHHSKYWHRTYLKR